MSRINVSGTGVDDWSTNSAVKAGHTHVFEGTNCQDAVQIGAQIDLDPEKKSFWLWGLVSDGCSGGDDPNAGLHSEVGSNLISVFATQEIGRIIREATTTPELVTDILFTSIRQLIDMNLTFTCPVDSDPELAAWFVSNYWLATIFGFVMNEDKLVLFRAGDGIQCVNNTYTEIDQNNLPTYIAYSCLPKSNAYEIPPELIPRKFDIEVYSTADIQRIMIATDGFTTRHEGKFSAAKQMDPSLTDTLNGQQWDKRGITGLKRWMNTRSDRGWFDDDCAIITIERMVEKQ